MNADSQPDLHAGRADAYPCKEETHAIIGCAFEVLNELGHGLNEKCYENSLVVEFKLRQIAFDQQRRFEVFYANQTNRRWTQMNADKKHIPYPNRDRSLLRFRRRFLYGGEAAATHLRPSASICG